LKKRRSISRNIGPLTLEKDAKTVESKGPKREFSQKKRRGKGQNK